MTWERSFDGDDIDEIHQKIDVLKRKLNMWEEREIDAILESDRIRQEIEYFTNKLTHNQDDLSDTV